VKIGAETERVRVATKLRCLCLCKVEMSLGGIAGSVSRESRWQVSTAKPGAFPPLAQTGPGREAADVR
jgi:hypothetical protein